MTIKTEDKFRKMDKSETQWLYNLRKNSWQAYHDADLPNRVKHLWKYTEPNNFIIEKPEEIITILPKSVNPEIEAVESGVAAYGFNNPDFTISTQVDKTLVEEGLIFGNLADAMQDHEDLVGNHLGHLVGSDFGKFEALNLALWNSGLFIYIPDNLEIKNPIRLRRFNDDRPIFHRLLVMAGKNSRATIVDEYQNRAENINGMINSVVEIYGDDSSRINYANLQKMNQDSTIYITQRTRLERDAHTTATYGALGGKVTKANVGTILNGTGAESRMQGVVFADGDQHFDYHTRHHHQSGETYSDINFKVVLKDSSRSAYTGLIRIDEDALNCQAFQENRNLLLNKGPQVESIPELEILCDQVQCSHGATMGPIDPEMIFYLASRGFSRDEAVRAIIGGFVEPTINALPDDLQDPMREAIITKLEGNQ